MLSSSSVLRYPPNVPVPRGCEVILLARTVHRVAVGSVPPDYLRSSLFQSSWSRQNCSKRSRLPAASSVNVTYPIGASNQT